MDDSKFIKTDIALFIFLIVSLVVHYLQLVSVETDNLILIIISGLASLPVVLSASYALINRKISIDLLASIALIASLLSEQWSSAVFINLMLTLARIFSGYTKNSATAAIKSLLKLRPQKVKVREGADIVEKPISDIKKGEIVIIETGERIPVDGVVESGEAAVDQSSLTGESMPVSKTVGDEVFSLTLNVSGSITVKVEWVGKDTAFEKMVGLIEKSQNEKVEIQTIGDRFATWYIIATVLSAFALYAFSKDINLVLAVLLVVCADDIAVANPLAFWAAVGRAAKKGIIIKGANYLEGFTKVKLMMVDKTGTLTLGKFKVEEIVPFENYSNNDVLKLAATAEFFSEHPLAKAVINYANANGIKFTRPESFQEFPAKGGTALFENKKIISGKHDFLRESGVKISDIRLKEVLEAESRGLSVTLVSYDGKLIGRINFGDQLRPGVKEAIEKLKGQGIKNWVMLTGDNEQAAARVASELGIGKFHANLMPEDKLKFVKKYIGKDYKVAMIGDGVNDAASLALADVGIVMGAIGSDAAIESADIALMKDDFSKIPEVMDLGRYTIKIAYQNFFIWGVVNIIGLFLVFSRIIGPEGAAAFNFATDFLPIINSLRVLKR